MRCHDMRGHAMPSCNMRGPTGVPAQATRRRTRRTTSPLPKMSMAWTHRGNSMKGRTLQATGHNIKDTRRTGRIEMEMGVMRPKGQ